MPGKYDHILDEVDTGALKDSFDKLGSFRRYWSSTVMPLIIKTVKGIEYVLMKKETSDKKTVDELEQKIASFGERDWSTACYVVGMINNVQKDLDKGVNPKKHIASGFNALGPKGYQKKISKDDSAEVKNYKTLGKMLVEALNIAVMCDEK